ncbi:MAG: hypothetical protein CML05_11530 [Pseudozobellia sp.]|nr:hypothetical protein [Pseudozobellia sp.]
MQSIVIKNLFQLPCNRHYKTYGAKREWLKHNTRKLKSLGLTISYTIGYEISLFGRFFVKKVLDKG